MDLRSAAATTLRPEALYERSKQAVEFARAWRFVHTVSGINELTMVSPRSLAHLVRFVDEVVDQGIPGNIVECGVWRGGASFVAARRLLARGVHDRTVWMFDSFEGLPPPQEIDGPAATAWAANTSSPKYYDNCTASIEDVNAMADSLGVRDNTRTVKGWFDQTLPATREEIGPIAILRIDGDWYDSVKVCLETMYDAVSPGGIVIIDDYFPWDGCAVAVHEFLGSRALPHRIERASGTAFFRKL